MNKHDFIIAYQWYNGCTEQEAEEAYRDLPDTIKRLYIMSFYDNAKLGVLSDKT